MICANNGTEDYAVQSDMMPMPTPGATALAGTFDWSNSGASDGVPALIDASKGDRLVIYRTTSATFGAQTGQQLTDLFTADAFTQTAASTTTLTGQFSTVPITEHREVTIDLDALPGGPRF